MESMTTFGWGSPCASRGFFSLQYGASLEDEVVTKFCAKTGWKHFDAGLLRHPVHHFLGGSPDGLLSSADGTEFALLEIKCPFSKAIVDEISGYYFPQMSPRFFDTRPYDRRPRRRSDARPQAASCVALLTKPRSSDHVQLCMEICDAESCWFVQYRPARNFWEDEIMSIIEVKRDREWFERILPTARAFWDDVLYYRAHMSELLVIADGKKRKRSPVGRTVTVPQPEGDRCMITLDDIEDAATTPLDRAPRWARRTECLIDV